MACSIHRIWMFDDPRSYGARSILHWAVAGLNIAGYESRLAQVELNAPDSVQRLRDDFTAFKPDAVLLANHPSRNFWRMLGYNSPMALSIVWLFDDPYMMGAEAFGDDVVLVSDPSFQTAAQARGSRTCMFLPVAAPDKTAAQFRDDLQADISYVGAAADLSAMRQQLSPELAAYFDSISEKKAAQPEDSLDSLLNEHPVAEGKRIQLSGQVEYFLYANANRMHRIRHLESVAERGLYLYGNEAWRPYIRQTSLETCFKGPVDPLRDYHDLIVSSKINLNLRSLQSFSSPTHRDFLVPRLGGFMIATASSPWLDVNKDEYLAFGFDRFPWAPQAATPGELRELVDHFLENPSARDEWIANARAVIESEHLFSHRMTQLMERLERLP